MAESQHNLHKYFCRTHSICCCAEERFSNFKCELFPLQIDGCLRCSANILLSKLNDRRECGTDTHHTDNTNTLFCCHHAFLSGNQRKIVKKEKKKNYNKYENRKYFGCYIIANLSAATDLPLLPSHRPN